MVRNNRHVTRLFFILVLSMAFLGAWVANQYWQPDLNNLYIQDITDSGDWIDLIASIGEAVLQLFLGITS
ncbi:hypothetical protein KFU94_27420 [Chloroflexi bacterium TSY]|nr:hypothetical protein [Chloroflexi bacterium TSY]